MEKKVLILILLIVLLFVMFAGADDIHEAVQQGDLTKTQSLIAKDPALQYASEYGHKKIAPLLKKSGADVALPAEFNAKPPFLERTIADGGAADQNFKTAFVCAENKGDSFVLPKP